MSKLFVRAIQIVRWLYNGFDNNSFQIEKTSSEAITIDMGSLGEELSVYLLKHNTEEEIEQIAIKVFIDCLRNYENGVTLVVIPEDYITGCGYSAQKAIDENPFGLEHYNIINVSTSKCIFDIADYIGKNRLSNKDYYFDYSPEDLFYLFYKHRILLKKYDKFKNLKRKLKNRFSNIKHQEMLDEIFEC